MKKVRTSRRRFLQLAAAATSRSLLVTSRARALDSRVSDDVAPVAMLGDDRILIEFDPTLRSRIWHRYGSGGGDRKIAQTPWSATENLMLGDGLRIDQFALQEHSRQGIHGRHGPGTRLRLIGRADAQIEKTVEIDLFERYPGLVVYRVSYRNLSPRLIKLHGLDERRSGNDTRRRG